METRRFLLLLFILCTAMPSVHAQRLTERLDSIIPTRPLAGKADSLLNARAVRTKYDTAYIHRPEGNWTFKMKVNNSGWKIRSIRSTGVSNVFESALTQSISFAIGYKGVSLSASLNPAKLTGRNKDMEFSATSYGKKFGGEVFYQQSNSFTATTTMYDPSSPDPANAERISFNTSSSVERIAMLNASGYFVFNSKRFSYPAAFSQSFIQKRSAGSWMLGATFFLADGHLNPSDKTGIEATQVNMMMFGMGCGYGYNLVLPHKWLLHMSAIPNVVVAHNNTMSINGKEERMMYKFPELLTTGRIAAIHHFKNYFTGVSAVIHLNTIGNHRDLFMENLKWKGSALIGMKL